MLRRVLVFAGFALSVLTWVCVSALGKGNDAPPSQEQPKPKIEQVANNHVVEQTFPPNGIMETAWKVEWDTVKGFGLIIKTAWFKTGPAADWMEVLGDARLADILVPYQPGSPRYWDVAYNFKLSPMGAADAGPSGKLLISNNGGAPEPCVVQEVRERGVIWKGNYGVRRGHSMVLWGCLHAVNYRYLIEYTFSDDGSITFRVGAAGRNLQGREWTPHMHNNYWRVNMHLGGKGHNTAYLMEVVEPKSPTQKLASQTNHTLFNDGKEGFADWDASKFTMLRVVNTQKKNCRGDYHAYDLMPTRHGTSRHAGPNEECSHHDFWVTKANDQELRYVGLPKYCNGEDIVDTDIVIWYGASMFHEPRSEDGVMKDDVWYGSTIVGWTGFTLRPNNIFDQTPLFPNPTEPVQPQKKNNKK
jgi:primary-amine oxidase